MFKIRSRHWSHFHPPPKMQVSLGDLLDDSKLKRYYFKASLVVHPDKVGELGVEEKFIAARVFDALTIAKEKAGV